MAELGAALASQRRILPVLGKTSHFGGAGRASMFCELGLYGDLPPVTHLTHPQHGRDSVGGHGVRVPGWVLGGLRSGVGASDGRSTSAGV